MTRIKTIDIIKLKNYVVSVSFWELRGAFHVGIDVEFLDVGTWFSFYFGFWGIDLSFARVSRLFHRVHKKRNALSFKRLKRSFQKIWKK